MDVWMSQICSMHGTPDMAEDKTPHPGKAGKRVALPSNGPGFGPERGRAVLAVLLLLGLLALRPLRCPLLPALLAQLEAVLLLLDEPLGLVALGPRWGGGGNVNR